MRNIAYYSNPMKWSEYFGQAAAVHLAQQFIINGLDEQRGLPRCIYISGPSGVGKTAYVRLLLRSLRCLNRAEDEYEPCGVCSNCTAEVDERLGGRAYGDTIWVQPGGRERGTLQSQVKEALSQAAQGQTHTGRPDRDCLKIVFDEFQAFPSDVRQELLLKTEVEAPNNNVCFIFVTMREDKIHLQERIALIRRSCPIFFNPFTQREIKEYLQQKYPTVPEETVDLVSCNSESSVGLALSYMDLIAQQDEEMNLDVAAHILQMATPTQRWYLWQSLEQRGDILDLRISLNAIETTVAPQRLAEQLIDDVINSMAQQQQPTSDQLFAIEQLNQYLRNYTHLNLLSHLIALRGISRLVSEEAVFRKNNSLNYAL